ncbi:formylmethanofuran dehydrogenase subunit C [Mangrovibrevibacter kandeliae]|uniref:formylmethanofuran dehydrogenase subunit C n=1 Tax=Mangrovibrevibacter kandeliae TaxID=2968473 RepID=UPI002118BD64|nr:formylmethanofuran dehydrogenase subunit C [Aurantimonas sp. CSK15Z-1]
MSGLTFTLRAEPEERLDLSPLVPSRLSGSSEREIAALPIGTTKRGLTVGDVFAIMMGEADAIRFDGGSARFDNLGFAMQGGEIRVTGDVGACLGRRMAGGRLVVEGNAGPFAGSGLLGGEVVVGGNAGDRLAGPLGGEMTGMRGGFLHVTGSAGRRAADRMRRGVIVVDGDVGEDAASRMIAGTLLVGGRAADGAGTLMRRGTVIVAGGVSELGPTFLDNGVAQLLALRLMARGYPGIGWIGERLARPMRRFGGDTAALGKGEVFVPAG